MPKYTFGHTDLASQRLKYLANVFGGLTETFVQATVDVAPALVLDLGCGPGDTTHMLAALTQAEQVIGLDISNHFINLATQTAHVTFQQHDLTRIPFPTKLANVAYSRFVLTHLSQPKQIIDSWLSQLRPEGFYSLKR